MLTKGNRETRGRGRRGGSIKLGGPLWYVVLLWEGAWDSLGLFSLQCDSQQPIWH